MKHVTFGLIAIAVTFVCSMAFAATPGELLHRGNEEYHRGEYDRAIEFYEQAIKKDPRFAEAYNALGMAHRARPDGLAEAVWYFRTATEVNPKHIEAYDNLSKAYYSLGDFDRAEAAALKALSINPNMPSVQYSLAWIYLLGKSRPEDAAFYFKKILDLKPIPLAYYGLGLSYVMSNQRVQTLEVITELRGMREDALAEQLENLLRQSGYMPRGSGPLVTVTPPLEPERGVLVPATPQRSDQPVEHEPRTIDLGGQIMRVRLRGTFVNLNELEKNQQAPAGK